MRRLASLMLVLATGCGGGDGPTGPTAVASVVLSSPVTSLNIGESATLTAVPRDAQGGALAGRTVAWSSSNVTVASVTSGGLVTAHAVGSTTITATVESKSAQASIVVAAGGPDCSAATPVSIAVGEVRVLTAAERALLCLPGGAAGAEFALIPVNLGTGLSALPVEATSANTSAPTAPFAALLAPGSGLVVPPMRRNVLFEEGLRERERFVRRGARAAGAATAGVGQVVRPFRRGTASINGLPANPALGTLVTLNAQSQFACSNPLNRVSRVVAVSNTAIVVEDTTAPPGGFTAAEYMSIAVTFDTMIYPLDTLAFGAPADIDQNGRVVLFFTTAVNQLTPASEQNSVIGGFFFARDLVPPNFTNVEAGGPCMTSNFGEMFYLPVVDVGMKYNRFFTNKAVMLEDVNATTIHEFQHLINASRRYYVTPEIVETEETWLNEAMSHLAQELLYYRVAGLSSKSDLGFTVTMNPPFRNTAMNAYHLDNLGGFSDFLKAPETGSPYADNGDLSTRGAGWALLRYALDHSPGLPATYLRALVDAPTQGIPNFNNVFSGIGGLAGAMRDWTVANFIDNTALTAAAKHTHPSWNYRDWLPHFISNVNRYPLATKSLVGGTTQSFTLSRGSSAYLRFRVAANGVGGVRTTSAGVALSTQIDLLLVRTQ